MVKLISLLSTFFISMATLSCLKATETQDIFSTTNNFYSRASAESVSKEQYLNLEIEKINSNLKRMRSYYKDEKSETSNIYIENYLTMLKELNEFSKQISLKSLRDVQDKVDEIYNEYFPQDDD